MSSKRVKTDNDKQAVIGTLLQAWKNNPYLRLGQLIFNATAGKSYPSCNYDYHQIIFHVEDGDLAKALARYPSERETNHDERRTHQADA